MADTIMGSMLEGYAAGRQMEEDVASRQALAKAYAGVQEEGMTGTPADLTRVYSQAAQMAAQRGDNATAFQLTKQVSALSSDNLKQQSDKLKLAEQKLGYFAQTVEAATSKQEIESFINSNVEDMPLKMNLLSRVRQAPNTPEGLAAVKADMQNIGMTLNDRLQAMKLEASIQERKTREANIETDNKRADRTAALARINQAATLGIATRYQDVVDTYGEEYAQELMSQGVKLSGAPKTTAVAKTTTTTKTPEPAVPPAKPVTTPSGELTAADKAIPSPKQAVSAKKPEKYTFDELTPQQLATMEAKRKQMGLIRSPLDRTDVATVFNAQPLEKRKAIFSSLGADETVQPTKAPTAAEPAKEKPEGKTAPEAMAEDQRILKKTSNAALPQERAANIKTNFTLAKNSLLNISSLPANSTLGTFSGMVGKDESGIISSLKGTLARKLSTDEQMFMQRMTSGLDRFMANVLGGGYATSTAKGALDTYKGQIAREGDNPYLAALFLAEMKQELEGALTGFKNRPGASPAQIREMENEIKEIQKAIPFTVEQVSAARFGSKKTMSQKGSELVKPKFKGTGTKDDPIKLD